MVLDHQANLSCLIFQVHHVLQQVLARQCQEDLGHPIKENNELTQVVASVIHSLTGGPGGPRGPSWPTPGNPGSPV